MHDLLRPAFVIALALAAPIVPFLLWGERLEPWIAELARETDAPGRLAALIVAALATDVLLPVPSSLVSTVGGAKLGFAWGTLASWTGTSLGATAGLALARALGAPAVARWAAADASRLAHLAQRFGPLLLAATRPLPVLAEATVILLGATGASWRRLWTPLLLSNLGIAATYSAVGAWARETNALPWAMALSIALPVAATAIARWRLKASTTIRAK